MGNARIDIAETAESSEVHHRGARVLVEVAEYSKSSGWKQASVCLTPADALRIGREMVDMAEAHIGRGRR